MEDWKLRPVEVLVAGMDHKYRVALVMMEKVVWSPSAREFSEYCGDEYLCDGEIIVELPVAI